MQLQYIVQFTPVVPADTADDDDYDDDIII